MIIFTTIAYAQTLAPPKLAITSSQAPPAKKDSIQVITSETPEVTVRETPQVPKVREPQVVTKDTQEAAKEPQVVTKEKEAVTKEKQAVAAKEVPSVVTKPMPEVKSKPAPQVVKKEKAQKIMTPISEPVRPIEPKTTTTPISEPIRPIAHYTFKTPEGKRESVPVITRYYPNQIVRPLATMDKHIDPKLMRAASIAEERAHAHSRSLCWHYVKEALLASGVIDTRPKSELARDAADDLVANYGFKKLSVRDPFAAPIGSVLVYGTSRSVGHVEFRTKYGFVSDFRSPTPSRRPLIGVYAKL
ncbi:MAG TPA: hypothetical protein VJR49_00220 [Chthoniobacterales bacterium]|nr:hypothetical protein [Chthoniobacterales bacterium]